MTPLVLLAALVLQQPVGKLSVRIKAEPADAQVRVGRKVIMKLEETVPQGKTVTSRQWMIFPPETQGFDQWDDGKVADFANPSLGVYVFICGVATDGEMAMSYHVIQVNDSGTAEPTPAPMPRIVPKAPEPPPEPMPSDARYKPKVQPAPLADRIRARTRDTINRSAARAREAKQFATTLVQLANSIDNGTVSEEDFLKQARRACQITETTYWHEWLAHLESEFAVSSKSMNRSQKSTCLRNIAEILLSEANQ